MKQLITSPKDLGLLVRTIRRAQGLTQTELAGACGVGLRFIVDLENGKPTCQLEKALMVVRMLGVDLIAETPDT